MNMSNQFDTFFDGDWQTMLEAVDMPFSSWDRKAAYLYFTKGTGDMPRRSTKKATNEVAKTLLEALKVLSLGQKASGNSQANHTHITGGRAIAFDGVIAISVPVAGIDWEAYPNTKLLIEALNNVGKELDLSIQDDGSVQVSSGDYEAIVPAGDASARLPITGDPMQGPVNETFVMALELAGRIISDTAETFRDASIHLEGPRLIATNGTALIEVNHGVPLPPQLVANMPKAFGKALQAAIGAEKKIVGIGLGVETMTAYFDDGSFIRTQLYRELYPADVGNAFERLVNAPLMMDPPKGLIDAVNAVLPFAHNGGVEFAAGKVAARNEEGDDWIATKDVAGLPDGVVIPGKFLVMYGDSLQKVWLGDPADPTPRVVLHGLSYRVVIAGSAPPPRPADAVPDTSGWGAAAPGGVPAWTPPAEGAAAPAVDGWGQPVPTAGQTGAPSGAAPAWGSQAAPPVAAGTPAPVTEPAPQPQPTTGGWGSAAPVATQPAPAQQQMPNAGQPMPAFLAPQGPITLPYTPMARRWQDPNNPGWDSYPYTLQPGETLEMFAGTAPNNPTQGGPGTLEGVTYVAHDPMTPAATQPAPTATAFPSNGQQLEAPWGSPAPGNAWGQPT